MPITVKIKETKTYTMVYHDDEVYPYHGQVEVLRELIQQQIDFNELDLSEYLTDDNVIEIESITQHK